MLDVALSKNYAPIISLSNNLEAEQLPDIHRECPCLFTLKDRKTKTENDPTSSSRESIRSKTKDIVSTGNKIVLSKICIFCEKTSKYKKKSRTRENLVSCWHVN